MQYNSHQDHKALHKKLHCVSTTEVLRGRGYCSGKDTVVLLYMQ
jgi:hypothetical protein